MNTFDYDDINLIPKYSTVNSRSDCDTSIKIGNHIFNSPVIPANMETVIDEKLAVKLAENGYFYIMHRFDVDNVSFVRNMKKQDLIASISVGVNKNSYDYIDYIIDFYTIDNPIIPDYICIDIAHGHCKKMKKMIKYIKSKLPNVCLIAGNVSTVEATSDLDKWGADVIKVGIGPGSPCTTYPTTGFGSRNIQASVVHECSTVTDKPIIADGGIKTPADITKSIVLGAKMCMVGGMLSSFIDSPGKTIKKDGISYKEFYGSASNKQSGKLDRIEGMTKLNPLKEITLLEHMNYLCECLESSISYGGGNKLSDLKAVKWI